MKFLHTADWHLGRIFHQLHLTDDQSYVLDQIVELAASEQVDAVIVAGDLYDRAVPPPEAVALLDRTWQRLIFDVGVSVIAIPGNHDSATRIGYGSKILAKAGLHIVADFDIATRPISIKNIDIFALPFTEPAEVRAWTGNPDVRDHASALQICIERMRPHFTPGRPRILVSHAFVAGERRESDSERPLSVGGAGTVPADAFDEFDYVALGHLHAPQIVSSRCLYSGSPLKYSFSEADDIKSVIITEICSLGIVTPRLVPVTPRRNVRNIEGRIADIIASSTADSNRQDYLRVQLTDDGALLNAIGRLRDAYPNVLQIERRFLQIQDGAASASVSRRQSTETELFSSFIREILGVEPAAAETILFQEALDELGRSEAEIFETTP